MEQEADMIIAREKKAVETKLAKKKEELQKAIDDKNACL